MIDLYNKARAVLRFLRSRAFAVSMLSLVFALVVFKITSMTNAVYVTDENGRSLSFTTESNPEKLLEQYGGGLSASQANFSGVSGHLAELNTTQVFQAAVTADGVTTNYEVQNGTTVGELLYENGITFDGNDLLSPSAEKPVQDGDDIVLKRVEYEEYTVDEMIPYQTVHKNSSLIRLGHTKQLQQGVDGVKTLTYMRRTVDGIREDVQLLGEHITQQPVQETILIGSPEPVSKLDFDLDVDEHGKPVGYSRKLTNQVATGYSARKGAKTASGRYAVTGHVAVNPNEIPYGSRLYITSADNRFVYGCAIAADTGTGLLADIVDVDLFYDTYQESVLNGRKIVEIYVLE